MNEESPPQEGTSPRSQITYQTALLSPGLVQTMIMDDSPKQISDKIWQFLGIDIPIADLREYDFKNILDFVDVAMINILENYKEEEWDNVGITETEKELMLYCPKCNKDFEYAKETMLCPECKSKLEEKIIEKILRSWKIVELWDAVHAKVYLKMCRARNGLTLRQITDSRTFSEQRIRGLRPEQPKKRSRWRII